MTIECIGPAGFIYQLVNDFLKVDYILLVVFYRIWNVSVEVVFTAIFYGMCCHIAQCSDDLDGQCSQGSFRTASAINVYFPSRDAA